MSLCLKEFVRGPVWNRKGKRVEEVVGHLYACLRKNKEGDMEPPILIGYAKRDTRLDSPKKDFVENLLSARALVLEKRLSQDVVGRVDGTVCFCRYDGAAGLESCRKLPYAISQALPSFLLRAKKYFKQGKLVGWAEKVLRLLPTE